MSEGKTPEGTPKGRLPGRKRCPRSRAVWSSPCRPETQGGAFGLSGLCWAPPLLVTGAWVALGGLLGSFGRAGFSEDAAGKGC